MSVALDHGLSSTVEVGRRLRAKRDEKCAQLEEASSQWFEDNRVEWEAAALSLLRKAAGAVSDLSSLDTTETAVDHKAPLRKDEGGMASGVAGASSIARDAPDARNSASMAVIIEASGSEVSESPAAEPKRKMRGRSRTEPDGTNGVEVPRGNTAPAAIEPGPALASSDDKIDRKEQRSPVRSTSEVGGGTRGAYKPDDHERSPAQKRSRTKDSAPGDGKDVTEPTPAHAGPSATVPSSTTAGEAVVCSESATRNPAAESIAALRAIPVTALKVVELRSELRNMGVASGGLKAALQARLTEAIDARVAELEKEMSASPVPVDEQAEAIEADERQEESAAGATVEAGPGESDPSPQRKPGALTEAPPPAAVELEEGEVVPSADDSATSRTHEAAGTGSSERASSCPGGVPEEDAAAPVILLSQEEGAGDGSGDRQGQADELESPEAGAVSTEGADDNHVAQPSREDDTSSPGPASPARSPPSPLAPPGKESCEDRSAEEHPETGSRPSTEDGLRPPASADEASAAPADLEGEPSAVEAAPTASVETTSAVTEEPERVAGGAAPACSSPPEGGGEEDAEEDAEVEQERGARSNEDDVSPTGMDDAVGDAETAGAEGEAMEDEDEEDEEEKEEGEVAGEETRAVKEKEPAEDSVVDSHTRHEVIASPPKEAVAVAPEVHQPARDEPQQQRQEQRTSQEEQPRDKDKVTSPSTVSPILTGTGVTVSGASSVPAATDGAEGGSRDGSSVVGSKRSLSQQQTAPAGAATDGSIHKSPRSADPAAGNESGAKKGVGGGSGSSASGAKRQKLAKDNEKVSLQERIRNLNKHYSAKKSRVHLEGAATEAAPSAAPVPARVAADGLSASAVSTPAPPAAQRRHPPTKDFSADKAGSRVSVASVASASAPRAVPRSTTSVRSNPAATPAGPEAETRHASPAEALARCLADDRERGAGSGGSTVSAATQADPVKKPSNLISGLHSFTSLVGKNEPAAPVGRWDRLAAGASASSVRAVPALRKAEEARALEERRARERAAARAKNLAAAGQASSSSGGVAAAAGERGTVAGSTHGPNALVHQLKKTGMLARLVPGSGGHEASASAKGVERTQHPTSGLSSSSSSSSYPSSSVNAAATRGHHAAAASNRTLASDTAKAPVGSSDSRGGYAGAAPVGSALGEARATGAEATMLSAAAADKTEVKFRDQRAQMEAKRNPRLEKARAEEDRRKAELEMKERRDAARLEASRRAKQEADARAHEQRQRQREQDRMDKENKEEERAAKRRAIEEAVAKAERAAAAVAAPAAGVVKKPPPTGKTGVGAAQVPAPAPMSTVKKQDHLLGKSQPSALAAEAGPKHQAPLAGGPPSKPGPSVLGTLSSNLRPVAPSAQGGGVSKGQGGGPGKGVAVLKGAEAKPAAAGGATVVREEEPPFDSYEMSDRDDSASDSDESDEEEKRPKKRVPRWVKTAALTEALNKQFSGESQVDPDSIFPPVMSCDLEAIFPVNKSRYHRRGSSANWEKDRVTPQEILTYKRSVGIVRSGK